MSLHLYERSFRVGAGITNVDVLVEISVADLVSEANWPAVILAFLYKIDFFRGQIISDEISTIVGSPKLACSRMKNDSNGISKAFREDLAVASFKVALCY